MVALSKVVSVGVMVVAVVIAPEVRSVAADQSDYPIQFDMLPVVAAEPAADDIDRVTVQLQLSSIIASPSVPRIDQFLVRCQPRDTSAMLVDYAPRTDARSDVKGVMTIKQSDESTQSVGLTFDGSYPAIGKGKAGADLAATNSESVQFEKLPSVQAVVASGTINRGRGAYFKLRWTSQQVLEGEKLFSVTFAVPQTWRGSLLDVSVIAQSGQKSLAGFESKDRTIGLAHFVVATYRQGDRDARDAAMKLAAAESRLCALARELPAKKSVRSLPDLLHHVAAKFDSKPEFSSRVWLNRLLVGAADPYVDRQISSQPMEIRVAVLDYCRSRKKFHRFSDAESL